MENPTGAPESVPTGCYKCGRPGHWSTDCPFSNSNSNNQSPPPPAAPPANNAGKSRSNFKPGELPKKKTKQTKQRLKLTAERLLSDDGLGYVLRHFPRAFKPRGRGHEMEDLGKLIELYAQWHSHLLPSFSFEQFVEKVEKLGATRRVRMTLRELRERVDKGGDPAKLHEPPVEKGDDEGLDVDVSPDDAEDMPMNSANQCGVNEDMFDEIFRKETEEPACSTKDEAQHSSISEPVDNNRSGAESSGSAMGSVSDISGAKVQLTEEQKARMEANRLKALEKAAARHAPKHLD